MNLEDWLHASPDHDMITRAEAGGKIRVTLRGERPDMRWIGTGETLAVAAQHALETRDAIRAARP